jgi:signal peptidase I
MEKIIKKINLKTFSVIGIILSVLSVSALILSAMMNNLENEELSTFGVWAAITLFLAVIYLLVFSILNLFKLRKTLSILGMILSFLAIILGSIVVIKYPPITLIDKLGDFLFLFSALFLGIISIISFIKSIYEPVIETSKPESKSKRILKKVLWIIGAYLIALIITNPTWGISWIDFILGALVVIIFIIPLESEIPPKPETKTKTILKKVLWTIRALLVGFIIFLIIGGLGTDIYVHLFIPDYLSFYKDPPTWYFSMKTILAWIGFILGWLTIIFITYKKVGRKTAKVFLIIFFLLIILSLVRNFVIEGSFMNNEWLEPYLHKGDFVLVEKFNKSIKKGDIVMTRTRNDFIVSLVIGLPGDKIELKDGTFFVNGEPLKNVSYNLYHANGIDSNIDSNTGNYFVVVPPDSFFGMSTYRKSADNEQKTQEHQITSNNNVCPPNSHLDPKDNLCYCDEDLIWNKKEGKDAKCVNGVDLSWWLYKQSDIVGKVIYPARTTQPINP